MIEPGASEWWAGTNAKHTLRVRAWALRNDPCTARVMAWLWAWRTLREVRS